MKRGVVASIILIIVVALLMLSEGSLKLSPEEKRFDVDRSGRLDSEDLRKAWIVFQIERGKYKGEYPQIILSERINREFLESMMEALAQSDNLIIRDGHYEKNREDEQNNQFKHDKQIRFSPALQSCTNQFIRGDITGNGQVDIIDVQLGLAYLFGQQVTVTCEDPLDVNDDETISIQDITELLNFLFTGGTSPAQPYPQQGYDEACDGSDNDGDGETDEGDGCGSQPVPLSSCGFSIGTTNIITRGAITWEFAQPVQHGTFANCDPWVIGPVNVISITPQTITDSNGRVMHGSMINPIGRDQGYDSMFFGLQGYPNGCAPHCYHDSLNVAQGISPTTPLTVQPGSSLLSSESKQVVPQKVALWELQVLTVLDQIPTQGSFRPPFRGTDKTITHTVADIDWTTLGTVSIPASADPFGNSPGTVPTSAYFESIVEYPFYDMVGGYFSQRTIPTNNGGQQMNLQQPGYGEYASMAVGEVALFLNLNIPQTEKAQTLYNFLQRGLDIYSIYQSSTTYNPDGTINANARDRWYCGGGGHCHGRLFPMLFAGKVLGESSMLDIRINDPERVFNEIAQTRYITTVDDGLMGYLWGDPTRPIHKGYISDWFSDTNNWDMIVTTLHGTHIVPIDNSQFKKTDGSIAEFAIKRGYNNAQAGWKPHYDSNVNQQYSYRTCCTAHAWGGQALAAKIMGIDDKYDHEAFFDYVNRYVKTQEIIYAYGIANTYIDDNGNVQSLQDTDVFGLEDIQAPRFTRDMWYEHADTYF